MTNKIFIICLVLSIFILIAGCGGEPKLTDVDVDLDPTSNTTIPTTTTTTTTVPTTTTTTTTTTTILGTMTGTIVLDGESAIISGVTVFVDGTQLSVSTNANGSFNITDVPIGNQSITATKSNFNTGTSINISIQSNQTTDIGTITLYRQYDLSSLVGNDNISSMTYFNNYLYIATDQKLYKVTTSNPTAEESSVEVTHNYTSMMAGELEGVELGQIILAHYNEHEGTPASNFFIYDELLDLLIPDGAGDEPDIITAGTLIDTVYLAKYNSTKLKFVKDDRDSLTPATTYNVTETGFTSMQYSNSYFYACNPTTIYKYNEDFSASTSILGTAIGAGINLIGIATDGTYIWVIDATTMKLYRITENTL